MPCAIYNFAVNQSEWGVVSETFLSRRSWFAPGNTLLAKVVDGYDGAKRFKQRAYRLSTVLALIQVIPRLQVPLGTGTSLSTYTPGDIFTGYLILDALIGNTDRHHENWGVVVDQSGSDVSFALAPTFDHASSLGRNESSESRRRRLTTRDDRDTVEAYASRARTAFFGGSGDNRTLTQRSTIEALSFINSAAVKMWDAKVQNMSSTFFRRVFEQIGPAWITEDAIEFGMRMLAAMTCSGNFGPRIA